MVTMTVVLVVAVPRYGYPCNGFRVLRFSRIAAAFAASWQLVKHGMRSLLHEAFTVP